MSDPNFTPQQAQAAQSAFYLELGRAVGTWSYIESSLATWFERLTKMHPVTSRRTFYSVSGFATRAMMFEAVMGHVKTDPDITPFFKKLMGRARQYSGTRNAIVHGDLLTIGFPGSKYYRQCIILEGAEPWHADPPESEVITIENLKMASENFGRLAACVVLSLNWDGKNADLSPLKYLGLVDKLPTRAHRERADPSLAAQFPIESKDVPHMWR